MILNTIACMLVLGMLVCRLNRVTKATQSRVRAQMVLLVMGVAANGVLPWSPWAEYGPVVLTVSVGAFLWLGRQRWRHGAPAGTTRPPAA